MKEDWYKRWYAPGIFTLAISAVVLGVQFAAALLGVEVPAVAFLALMVGGMVFSLSWAIEKHWTKIPGQVRDDVTRIRDDVIGLSGRVSEPYLHQLRERLFARARPPLRQLVDPGRAIPSVEECTEKLIEHLHAVEPGEDREIVAVCGQKAWESHDVRRYYKENYEKSRQGVKVKRIFIAERDKKKFSAGEKEVLAEHLSDALPNVEGRVIFPEDLDQLDQYGFPAGFGFAILGKAVIVHWGLDRAGRTAGREAGRILEDPWFVEIHRGIFKRMWGIAKGGTPEEREEIRRRILREPPARGRRQVAAPKDAPPQPAPPAGAPAIDAGTLGS